MDSGAGPGTDAVVRSAVDGGGSGGTRKKDGLDPSVLVEYEGIDEEGKWRLEQVLELWSEWYESRAAETRGKGRKLFQGKVGFIDRSNFAAHVDIPGAEDSLEIEESREFNQAYEKRFSDIPQYDRAREILPTKRPVNDAPPAFHTAGRCFNCGSYSHNVKGCRRSLSQTNIAHNLSKYDGPMGARRGGRGGRGPGRGGGGRDGSRDAHPYDVRKREYRARGMKRFLDDDREEGETSRGKKQRDGYEEANAFHRSGREERRDMYRAGSSNMTNYPAIDSRSGRHPPGGPNTKIVGTQDKASGNGIREGDKNTQEGKEKHEQKQLGSPVQTKKKISAEPETMNIEEGHAPVARSNREMKDQHTNVGGKASDGQNPIDSQLNVSPKRPDPVAAISEKGAGETSGQVECCSVEKVTCGSEQGKVDDPKVTARTLACNEPAGLKGHGELIGGHDAGLQLEKPVKLASLNIPKDSKPLEEAESLDDEDLMCDSDSGDEVIIIKGTGSLALAAPSLENLRYPVDGLGADGKVNQEMTSSGNVNISGSLPKHIIPAPAQAETESPLIEILPAGGLKTEIEGVRSSDEKALHEDKKAPGKLESVKSKTYEVWRDDREEGELDIEEGEIVETSHGPKRVSEPGLFFPVATGKSTESRRSKNPRRRLQGSSGQELHRLHSRGASPKKQSQKVPLSAPVSNLSKPKRITRENRENSRPAETPAVNRPTSSSLQSPGQGRGREPSSGSPITMKTPATTTVQGTLPSQAVQHSNSVGGSNMNSRTNTQTMYPVHNNGKGNNAVFFGKNPNTIKRSAPSANVTPPPPPTPTAGGGHHGNQTMGMGATQKVVMQSGLVGQNQPLVARNPQIVGLPPVHPPMHSMVGHMHHSNHHLQMPPGAMPHPPHQMVHFPGHHHFHEALGHHHHHQHPDHFSHTPPQMPVGMGGQIGHMSGFHLSNQQNNHQQRFSPQQSQVANQQYPHQQLVQLGNSMVVINTNGQQVVVKPSGR